MLDGFTGSLYDHKFLVKYIGFAHVYISFSSLYAKFTGLWLHGFDSFLQQGTLQDTHICMSLFTELCSYSKLSNAIDTLEITAPKENLESVDIFLWHLHIVLCFISTGLMGQTLRLRHYFSSFSSKARGFRAGLLKTVQCSKNRDRE